MRQALATQTNKGSWATRASLSRERDKAELCHYGATWGALSTGEEGPIEHRAVRNTGSLLVTGHGFNDLGLCLS